MPKKALVKLQSSFPSMFRFPVLPQPGGLGAATETKVLLSARSRELGAGAEPAAPRALSVRQYWLKEFSLPMFPAYSCLSVVNRISLLLWMKGVSLLSPPCFGWDIFNPDGWIWFTVPPYQCNVCGVGASPRMEGTASASWHWLLERLVGPPVLL